MHDFTHIRRTLNKAREIGKNHPHHPRLLTAAIYFHGLIVPHERKIRSFLKNRNTPPAMIEKIIQIAWESQKNSRPETPEGQILHDAHLLEGDDNFLITKCLVTGSARGQSLKETIDYFFSTTLNRHSCIFPENQKHLNKRYQIARKYFESLKAL